MSRARVGGVLGALSASHPGLYDRLMTEQGLLRPHVNLFVDGENIRFTGGLGTRVEGAQRDLRASRDQRRMSESAG